MIYGAKMGNLRPNLENDFYKICVAKSHRMSYRGLDHVFVIFHLVVGVVPLEALLVSLVISPLAFLYFDLVSAEFWGWYLTVTLESRPPRYERFI